MMDGFDFSKMNELLKDVQEKAKELQEQAKNKEFCVRSGAGMIEIKANGSGEIIDINIDDSLLEDKDSLQILLISSINDVIKLVENEKKQMATNIFGGFPS